MTLGDKIRPHGSCNLEWFRLHPEDVKEHIQNAQKRLKEEHEAWRKEGVIGEFFDDSFKLKIDRIFKEEFGEKLLLSKQTSTLEKLEENEIKTKELAKLYAKESK